MRLAYALLCATAATVLYVAWIASTAHAQSFGAQSATPQSPRANGRGAMMQSSPPNEIGGGRSGAESPSTGSNASQRSSRSGTPLRESQSASNAGSGGRSGNAASPGGQEAMQAPLAHHLVPAIPTMPRSTPASWPAETLVMERIPHDKLSPRPTLCIEAGRPVLSQKAAAAYGLRPYEITGAIDAEPERLGCTIVVGTQGFTEGVARILGWPGEGWYVAKDTRAPTAKGTSISEIRTSRDGVTPITGTAGDIRVERRMENWWRIW